jgi:hypothetical protein
MSLFACAVALAAVTAIYLFWRSYLSVLLRRRSVLRERVAFMLWVMADDEAAAVPGTRERKLDSWPELTQS